MRNMRTHPLHRSSAYAFECVLEQCHLPRSSEHPKNTKKICTVSVIRTTTFHGFSTLRLQIDWRLLHFARRGAEIPHPNSASRNKNNLTNSSERTSKMRYSYIWTVQFLSNLLLFWGKRFTQLLNFLFKAQYSRTYALTSAHLLQCYPQKRLLLDTYSETHGAKWGVHTSRCLNKWYTK